MHPSTRHTSADTPEPGGGAGIGRATAASSEAPRRAIPLVRVGTRPLWTTDMARPLTERSTNAAKLDVPLPQNFPDAFQRLVDERNRATGGGKRVYTRDLFEEAIGELIQRVECERVTFVATPFRGFVRKKFWVDGTLKGGVEQLALAHGITRSAVVMTAFHHYLDRHGALRNAAGSLGS